MASEFYRHIFEKSSNIGFHKIRPEGAELFHAYGQMDRERDTSRLTVAIRNIAKVLKNYRIKHL